MARLDGASTNPLGRPGLVLIHSALGAREFLEASEGNKFNLQGLCSGHMGVL